MKTKDFIRLYESKRPDDHYFEKETLEFFGETIKDMEVLPETKEMKDARGETHTCYVLKRHQFNFLSEKHLMAYTYFDVDTLEPIETTFDYEEGDKN